MPRAKPLEEEVQVFEHNRQAWAANHAGQYVVIQRNLVVGFFGSFEQAYKAALEKCGQKSLFLVKQINAVEPVYHIAWMGYYELRMGEDGPILQVEVATPIAERELALGGDAELPPALPVKALIDTGAGVTVINPTIAENCQLRYIAPARISVVGNVMQCRSFAASMQFPGTGIPAIAALEVRDAKIIHTQYSCLIGRDILRFWRLTYDGPRNAVRIEW